MSAARPGSPSGHTAVRRVVERRVARSGRTAFVAIATALLLLGGGDAAEAQLLQGRVLDQRDEKPVSTAMVRLVDQAGDQRGVSIADSLGLYRIRVPEPGVYRLEAARLGYQNFETPLLEASNPEGEYPIDLLLTPAPVEIEGLTVRANVTSAERTERLLRRDIGLAPASLRYHPFDLEDITHHIDLGHDLVDMMRFSNLAGIVVKLDLEGWCFSLRGFVCLPVYLDGTPLLRDFVDTVPLDMVVTIAVVTPSDGSLAYPLGAVLLYSQAWAR